MTAPNAWDGIDWPVPQSSQQQQPDAEQGVQHGVACGMEASPSLCDLANVAVPDLPAGADTHSWKTWIACVIAALPTQTDPEIAHGPA